MRRRRRRRRRGETALTSSGVERVTVGELRLRGRRIWGSLRWPPLAPPGEGVAPPLVPAPAELLAPSSVFWQREREPLKRSTSPHAAAALLQEALMRAKARADKREEHSPDRQETPL